MIPNKIPYDGSEEWVNCSNSTGNVKYKVVSGIVFVMIYANSINTDNWTSLGTLPTQILPPATIYTSPWVTSSTSRTLYMIRGKDSSSDVGVVKAIGTEKTATIISWPLE